MSEHHDETAPSSRTSWKDRVYGVRSVAAVAVAGLIIGGGAGAAIHTATADDGGRDGRPGRMGNGGPGQMPGGPGGGQMPGGPGGGQRQQQPPPNGLPVPPDGGDDTAGNSDT